MTRISFLHNARDRLQATATWLGQACRRGEKVIVYAPLEGDLERLDRLLWMHPATGFTPHCFAGSVLAAETPVILTTELDRPAHDQCLVNLSNDIPPGFSTFERLVEVVSTADHVRIPGRERFRFYRERGYALETEDISGDAT
ncbi:MAG: DNA polymerase III subunit chi [Rhodocyclales bacterium]|nr:DNA polymerase III subunit chi [Rhodocyclales bacterium]